MADQCQGRRENWLSPDIPKQHPTKAHLKKCPVLEKEPGNVQAGRRGTGRECGSLHEACRAEP
ncbi:hypothetical protein MPL3365_190213 [Mesorhizobium plurifarium]|uniref:Uncharacterized protein n=1 Tax=Mesorhizobium plurifarium TaxID=69974 RepID=A0A090G850_MESPL|nr:hypothetical protein MPL3365_190213 [Mesorhizobium plurifarium]